MLKLSLLALVLVESDTKMIPCWRLVRTQSAARKRAAGADAANPLPRQVADDESRAGLGCLTSSACNRELEYAPIRRATAHPPIPDPAYRFALRDFDYSFRGTCAAGYRWPITCLSSLPAYLSTSRPVLKWAFRPGPFSLVFSPSVAPSGPSYMYTTQDTFTSFLPIHPCSSRQCYTLLVVYPRTCSLLLCYCCYTTALLLLLLLPLSVVLYGSVAISSL
ncbi:hypothetical protein C8R47DRAFT_11386 [Mycena vitilis]|nr:hypothetical protein C8R47DRAFT_11386 [Mycena vitilis]